jgi:hypothetical protein
MLAGTNAQTVAGDALLHHLGAADQDRPRQSFVAHRLRGAQDALVLAFAEHHARRLLLRRRKHRAHQEAGGIDEIVELLGITVHVGDRPRGDAGIHRCLRHRRRDLDDQARIEGLGDQVLGAEGQFLRAIGGGHHFRLFGVGQFGDGPHRGDLHRFVDGRRTYVQRAAEHERKAQHVVDLVRIVRTTGAEDSIRAHGLGVFRPDLGIGIGHGQDQRIARHGLDHFRLQYARGRQPEENVGAGRDVAQCACVGRLRITRLRGIEAFSPGMDHALAVDRVYVLRVEAEAHQQVEAGDRRCAGAGADQLDLGDVLADHAHAVQHRGAGDDGRTVLIVVEHRYLHPLAQLRFDIEALGRLDVFQVDAAEGGLQGSDDVDQFVGVVLRHLDVEHVDAGELLEQHALAFHHRLAGQRPDVAQAEYRSTVGDDRHQVGTRGVQRGRRRIAHDLVAGRRDAWRIGQRQVGLVGQRLGRGDGDLAGFGVAVILQRRSADAFVH